MVFVDHSEEFARILYIQTGEVVCQSYGGLFRLSCGMYFSTRDTGKDVYDLQLTVCTDGYGYGSQQRPNPGSWTPSSWVICTWLLL